MMIGGLGGGVLIHTSPCCSPSPVGGQDAGGLGHGQVTAIDGELEGRCFRVDDAQLVVGGDTLREEQEGFCWRGKRIR